MLVTSLKWKADSDGDLDLAKKILIIPILQLKPVLESVKKQQKEKYRYHHLSVLRWMIWIANQKGESGFAYFSRNNSNGKKNYQSCSLC